MFKKIVVETFFNFLSFVETFLMVIDLLRYTFAARELAQFARGELRDGYWKMRDQNRFSSVDDISVFVIPLRPASVIHSI